MRGARRCGRREPPPQARYLQRTKAGDPALTRLYRLSIQSAAATQRKLWLDIEFLSPRRPDCRCRIARCPISVVVDSKSIRTGVTPKQVGDSQMRPAAVTGRRTRFTRERSAGTDAAGAAMTNSAQELRALQVRHA